MVADWEDQELLFILSLFVKKEVKGEKCTSSTSAHPPTPQMRLLLVPTSPFPLPHHLFISFPSLSELQPRASPTSTPASTC